MKLEKGKFYKRFDGKIVGPARESNYSLYPFKVGDIYYTDAGTISGLKDLALSLVEEVNASIPPETTIEVLAKESQKAVDDYYQRVLASSFKGDKMPKSNESEEKKSRPKYPAEQLKDIENTLISLITTTVHYTALKYLTQALADVRCANTCLDENKRFFYGSE